jgi:hypothetical protein
MIMNLLVIAIVFGVGLTWGLRGKGRGLFSAMIATLCVVIAGAVAFAAWEPLVYTFLLERMPDLAWGLGLLLPFCIALGILRSIAEISVPKNMQLDDATNFVGGTAFGLVSGVIVAGIFVTSLSFMRFGPTMLGYRAVTDDRGNLTADRSLWIPADKITIGFYEYLSSGVLGTSTPLAERAPRLHEQAAMARMVFSEKGSSGKPSLALTTIREGQFSVQGRYRVTSTPDEKITQFLDDLGKPADQKIVYPSGDPPPADARVEGVFIEFQASAAEKTGQVLVSPGQIRMIVRQRNGEVMAIHPFAVLAQPEAGGGLKRFRVASDDLHFPSVGGASTAVFGFEFAVPADAEPTDLFVKNYRVAMGPSTDVKAEFAGFRARDEAIRTGKLASAVGVTPGGAKLDAGSVDTSGSQVVSTGGDSEVIRADAMLPNRWIINRGNGTGGITVDSSNRIVDGQHDFTLEQLNIRGVDRKLQVEAFATTDDTGIIRVELARGSKQSLLGRSVETAESILQPLLADSQGNLYEPIGYVYSDGSVVTIRFTPGDPLRDLSQIPALSTAKQNQTLYLIYRPTKGVRITRFLLGSKEIASFPGGVEVR